MAQYNPNAIRGYTDNPDEVHYYFLSGYSTEEEQGRPTGNGTGSVR